MNYATLKPLHDRVLVRRMEKPSDSGLIVIREHPEMVDFLDGDTTGAHQNNQRTGLIGTVVAVGPGKYDEDGVFRPTEVKPGEVVMFTAWNDLGELDAHEYMLIREGDIWGWARA